MSGEHTRCPKCGDDMCEGGEACEQRALRWRLSQFMDEDRGCEYILLAVQAGLEYAEHFLAEHDASIGRTTPKNRYSAELAEQHIDLMRRVLARMDPTAPPHQ